MSKVQMLRALVKQRLTAAAEEIFGLFERTIAEHEEELSRSKEENERQQKLLDAVFNPQLQLNRAVVTADVQQLLMVQEVPPKQQEWSPSLDQEDPEPPHIKEEQKDLWTSQEGEQLQGLEEADIKFPFTSFPVKSEEDDEEKPQSSQLHQRQTEADGEDCSGPESACNSDPDSHLQPDTGDSSEPGTEHSDDWKETREPESDLNFLKNNEVPLNDLRCRAGEKTFSCSEKRKTFGSKAFLNRHLRRHTGQNRFVCSFCKKSFSRIGNLQRHVRIHTGEKPFSCSVCNKAFVERGNLNVHMRTHTGEKPFSCSVCKKYFTHSGALKRHMRTHTGEKPFSCLVCGKVFAESGSLKRHMRIHTGEKRFSCSSCGHAVSESRNLTGHIKTQPGEKGCRICNQSVTWLEEVQ